MNRSGTSLVPAFDDPVRTPTANCIMIVHFPSDDNHSEQGQFAECPLKNTREKCKIWANIMQFAVSIHCMRRTHRQHCPFPILFYMRMRAQEGSGLMKDAAYSQFAKPSRANPFSFWPTPQRNATEIMGYTVRVDEWRYTCWFGFDGQTQTPNRCGNSRFWRHFLFIY